MSGNPSGLRVRRAVHADADAIGDAHASAWEMAYTHIFEPEFLAAAVEGRRVGWRNSISGILAPPNVLLVGEVDGKVRAFAHAAPEPRRTRAAEIRAFYAHPGVWGSELTALLMRDLCELLLEQGYDEVVLWTARDAHRARGFYEKVGFCLTRNTRHDRMTDWTGTRDADVAEVEYGKRLQHMPSSSSGRSITGSDSC